MDKIDVLKIVRANDEKFKLHLDKLRRLEEKEKNVQANKMHPQSYKYNKYNNQDNDDDCKYLKNYVYDQLCYDNDEEADEDDKTNDKRMTNKVKDIKRDEIINKNHNQANNNEDGGKYNSNQYLPPKENIKQSSNTGNNNDLSKKLNTYIKDLDEQNSSEEEQIKKKSLQNKAQMNISNNNKSNKRDKKENKKHIKTCIPNDHLSQVKDYYASSNSSKNSDDEQQINQENHHDNPNAAYYSNNQIENYDEAMHTNESHKDHTIKANNISNIHIASTMKSTVPEKINAAVLDNESKRPYTAYTYSTIQKIKTNDKPTKKTGVFEKKVMKKKYKGKTDKVALYQMHQNDWAKKSYLKK